MREQQHSREVRGQIHHLRVAGRARHLVTEHHQKRDDQERAGAGAEEAVVGAEPSAMPASAVTRVAGVFAGDGARPGAAQARAPAAIDEQPIRTTGSGLERHRQHDAPPRQDPTKPDAKASAARSRSTIPPRQNEIADGGGAEDRLALVGAERYVRRQAGGQQGRQGEQPTARGDGVDQPGEERRRRPAARAWWATSSPLHTLARPGGSRRNSRVKGSPDAADEGQVLKRSGAACGCNEDGGRTWRAGDGVARLGGAWLALVVGRGGIGGGCSADVFDLNVDLGARRLSRSILDNRRGRFRPSRATRAIGAGGMRQFSRPPPSIPPRPQVCRRMSWSRSGATTSTDRCFAQASAHLSQPVNVLQDDAFVTRVERHALTLVHLVDVAYTIPSNTLTFEIPQIDIYAGPAGSRRETDPGVAIVGSTQPVAAGTVVTEAQHVTIGDDTPARPFIEDAIENRQEFVFIVVATRGWKRAPRSRRAPSRSTSSRSLSSACPGESPSQKGVPRGRLDP